MNNNSRSLEPANPARVYDYLLGGKDNFPADRRAGDHLIAAKPDLLANVRANRRFLARAVRYLAAEAGIRQFLDIGTGLPNMDNTHEVAQRTAPDSRVAYIDNDPNVVVMARALLASTAQGTTEFIQADLRDPDRILQQAARVLDLGQPVAIMLLGILYLLGPDEHPYDIVSRLGDAVAQGSYLVVSHPASDIHAEQAAAGARVYQQATGIPQTNRTHDEVAKFLAGFNLIDPGVVQLNHWRPDPGDDTSQVISSWAAAGRK